MSISKSPIIGVIAVAVIVAAGFAIKGCSRSSESALRKHMGNQVCLACGQNWQMDTKAMMAERLEDPTGNRFTLCPACHEWRGVGFRLCAECGKRIPKALMHEATDGTITTWQRTLCDECAAAGGGGPDTATDEQAHDPVSE